MPKQDLTPRELNNVYKTRDALISEGCDYGIVQDLIEEAFGKSKQ